MDLAMAWSGREAYGLVGSTMAMTNVHIFRTIQRPTHHIPSPIWSSPFPNIPITSSVVHAKRRNSPPEPVLKPTIVEEVSMDDEDDLLLDEFGDGSIYIKGYWGLLRVFGVKVTDNPSFIENFLYEVTYTVYLKRGGLPRLIPANHPETIRRYDSNADRVVKRYLSCFSLDVGFKPKLVYVYICNCSVCVSYCDST